MKKYKWMIVDFISILIIFAISTIFVVLGKWNWKWFSFFCITTYVLNTFFVIFNVANTDNSTEKLAWIFFMVCIPVVGIVFYMLFRVRRVKALEDEIFDKEFNEFLINEYNQKNSNEFEDIYRWQSNLVKRNFYNTNLKVYEHGYESYEVLLNDIKNAKKYIHIEMYIIKNSEIYQRLKNVLIQKIKENVEIRMIIDKFGSWKVPIDEFKDLESYGIKIAFFNVPYYPYVRHTDNRRLHRKSFIIDGKIVYFGGLNISDEYCSLSEKYGYWADSSFSADGKIVNDYESVFLYDWFKITKEKLDPNKYINNEEIKSSNSKILTFEESPNRESNLLEESIIFWINNSNESIVIATPYFIPTEKIFVSLKNALRRNVEIKICIPGKPDKPFTYLASLHYSEELEKYGAKIYKFNETFVHSKFGIFDNKFAYTGTNNLDMRSLFSNEESINVIFGQEAIENLNKIFENYVSMSVEHKYVKKTKLCEIRNNFIFKLAAPLM